MGGKEAEKVCGSTWGEGKVVRKRPGDRKMEGVSLMWN